MTLEQASNKKNVGKKVKLCWGDRILEGILTYQYNNGDNACFVKINGSTVWWAIKDISKLCLIEEAEKKITFDDLPDILYIPMSYIEYRHSELLDCHYRELPDEICKRVSIINKLKEKFKLQLIVDTDYEVPIKKTDWKLFNYYENEIN